jgi:hypothetical protein
MAKPIFLCKVPIDSEELLIAITQKRMENRLDDYHVLIIKADVSEVEFQAYYDKDLIETDFEAFKREVKNVLA